ncbi:MAG TPA: DNA ligase (NAD(+)) LigA, partial [Lachnospiraceae bacterium]|nr:DNA ligase (NAD(+)) LigA [Lachnospiraceae bacterium]
SRTGLINPVAVFEPVELEGTTVSRASVHNVSILEGLELGVGDTITVYKANMIIPQIAENLTGSDTVEIPETCPVCGGRTKIRQINDVQSLYCTNEECEAKKIKSFTLFVSRDAMNIEGLSEATLEKFIAKGYIHEFADIFHLGRFQDEIIEMEGFGEKSFERLMQSLERARHTTLPRLIYALGIPNVGLANAKLICEALDYDVEKIRHAGEEAISAIDGIGGVIAGTFCGWFAKEEHQSEFTRLLKILDIEKPEARAGEQILAGKTFVITGSVEHFANRKALKEQIESLGGKVTGSVTGKTDYLINNDRTSGSAKNRKAKELKVEILSEDMFLEMIGQP